MGMNGDKNVQDRELPRQVTVVSATRSRVANIVSAVVTTIVSVGSVQARGPSPALSDGCAQTAWSSPGRSPP